jgi:ribosomal protein S18 acetylase RimI-like enzyme
VKTMIRRATRRDAAHLAGLCMDVQSLHVAMQPSMFRVPSNEELVAFFRERLADPDFTVFLAVDDGSPVGYVMLHVIRRPAHVLVKARDCVEVDHIQVNESHRRQGIGRRLAAKAIEVARACGIEAIQLSTWAQNARAIATFTALGFKPQRIIMTLENREMA